MRPLFTIHAGEYLVAEFLEKRFKSYRVWVPSKDVGVDLLVTNPASGKYAGLQVKFSKDFNITTGNGLSSKLKSFGWWTLKAGKIEKSEADVWVFVLYNFNSRSAQYLVIEPKALLGRLQSIHGKQSIFNVYLAVTRNDKCWEARGLPIEIQSQLYDGSADGKRWKERNMTSYLDAWDTLDSMLRTP